MQRERALLVDSADILEEMSGDDDHSAYLHNHEQIEERAEIMEVILIIMSTFSFIGCTCVIGTALKFPSMWYNKIYFQMIVMIAMCDWWVSVSGLMGFPDDAATCAAQGAILMFFLRGSWMWTFALAYKLNQIIRTCERGLSFVKTNIIIWSINLIMEIAPLTTGITYGEYIYFRGLTICSLRGASHDRKVFNMWMCSVFFGPLMLVISVLTILSFQLYCKLKYIGGPSSYNNTLVKSVAVYPLVLFICWLPLLAQFFVLINTQTPKLHHTINIETYTSFQVVEIWTICSGLLSSIVYFSLSGEARNKWYKVFRSLIISTSGKNQDDKDADDDDLLSTDLIDFLDDDEMTIKLGQEKMRSFGSRYSLNEQSNPNPNYPPDRISSEQTLSTLTTNTTMGTGTTISHSDRFDSEGLRGKSDSYWGSVYNESEDGHSRNPSEAESRLSNISINSEM